MFEFVYTESDNIVRDNESIWSSEQLIMVPIGTTPNVTIFDDDQIICWLSSRGIYALPHDYISCCLGFIENKNIKIKNIT